MKKITLVAFALLSLNAFSQDYFSALSTSRRVGILNGENNPSEFANLNSRFEIRLIDFSVNVSNNKVGFKDILKGDNVESLIFSGNDNANFDISTAINLPAFAMRIGRWGFGISSKGYIKASIIDVDPDLGEALLNNGLNSVGDPSTITSDANQRVNATTYGEIALSASRAFYQTDQHRINAGLSLKFLFPGSYANIGLNKFNGTIKNNLLDVRLTDVNSTLDIAYSGNFGSSINNSGDYTKSLFGGLNGIATDFGIDYQWLNGDNDYKLKVGLAVRNIGSMKFKGSDNVREQYSLNIPNGDPGLDLNEFNDVNGLEDIQAVLNNHPEYFSSTSSSDEFKVKLPTSLNFYADYKVISKLSVTLYLQQKLGSQSENDQLTSQNLFSITPRFTTGLFEAFLPIGNNEIAGGTVGLGFRVGGFFLGSNSILSAVSSNSKQADAYVGFRYGFL